MGKRNRKLPPTITKGKQSTLGVQDSSDSDSTSTTLSASGGGTHKRPRSGFFTSNKSKSEKNERNSPASAAAPNPTEFVTGGVSIPVEALFQLSVGSNMPCLQVLTRILLAIAI